MIFIKNSIYLVAILIFVSCKKEKAYWDVDYAIPVASSSLSLSNLFPDSLISNNKEGELSLLFEDEIFNYSSDSLLIFPDTCFNFNFQAVTQTNDFIIMAPGTELHLNQENENAFLFSDDISLDEIKIKTGDLTIHFENPLNEPLFFKYNLKSATINESILSFSIPIKATTKSGYPPTFDTTIHLEHYNVSLKGASGTKSNTIIQDFIIEFPNDGVADTIYQRDIFRFSACFSTLNPEIANGYLGNKTFSVGLDSTKINYFEKIHSGNITLDSVNLDLNIVNEFGVPIQTTIHELQSIHPIKGNVSLFSDNLNQPLLIPPASINNHFDFTTINPTKTSISFSGSNSNIKDFIENLPLQIAYRFSAKINPQTNILKHNNFIQNQTYVKGQISAKIPLRFSAQNLALKDTTTLNIDAIANQLNDINEGKLTLKATNFYPFSLVITGVFLDENNKLLDYFIEGPDNLIGAPLIDVNGKVTVPKISFIQIPLNKAKLQNLLKAKKIAYYIKFNTESGIKPTLFYEDYNLDLLLSTEFNYNIK